jgi:hypothetical protein
MISHQTPQSAWGLIAPLLPNARSAYSFEELAVKKERKFPNLF